MQLQLNGKFLAAPPTGVHRVALELANALADLIAAGDPAANGFDIEALVPRDGQAGAATLRMPWRTLGPLVHIPWEQLTLPLRRGRGTLLNLCNIGPVLSRDAVTMIHDVQVRLTPDSYSRAFRLWYHLVQPAFARRHRHLLTVSHFSRDQIVTAGLAPRERVSVIHNGVDHVLREAADPATVARLGLTPGRYVVGLANTQAHKNTGVLLKAFADPALADVHLVLFGSATGQDFRDAGHHVPDNVIFAGRLPDAALRGLLEAALCLAFPSTTEGFGLPPVEAMLLGCPALVAPCGALPEVCGDAAGYVAPHDPQGWSHAIRRWIIDPADREAAKVAGLAWAARFTWEAAARQLLTVLSRECNGG